MPEDTECRRADELLVDYLYGELPEPQKSWFDEHLQNCAVHAEAAAAYGKVLEALRDHEHTTDLAIDRQALVARARAATSSGGRPAWWRIFAWRPVVAAAAASLVFVVIAVVVMENGAELRQESPGDGRFMAEKVRHDTVVLPREQKERERDVGAVASGKLGGEKKTSEHMVHPAAAPVARKPVAPEPIARPRAKRARKRRKAAVRKAARRPERPSGTPIGEAPEPESTAVAVPARPKKKAPLARQVPAGAPVAAADAGESQAMQRRAYAEKEAMRDGLAGETRSRTPAARAEGRKDVALEMDRIGPRAATGGLAPAVESVDKKNTGDCTPSIRRARRAMEKGEAKEAERLLSAVGKNCPQPHAGTAYYLLARLYQLENDCPRQVTAARRALSVSPRDPMAAKTLLDMASCLVRLGRFEQARRTYLRVIRDFPGSAEEARSELRLLEKATTGR
ncbi:MAG: hypothetical protein D6806_10955 [Deltaproteobacteria bacterium]|nr:MAG: hypothetical protein D6806_10955 [Deltaproteobacteria bacterium]